MRGDGLQSRPFRNTHKHDNWSRAPGLRCLIELASITVLCTVYHTEAVVGTGRRTARIQVQRTIFIRDNHFQAGP